VCSVETKRSHICYVDEISVKLRRHYFKIRGTNTVYKYACTNKLSVPLIQTCFGGQDRDCRYMNQRREFKMKAKRVRN